MEEARWRLRQARHALRGRCVPELDNRLMTRPERAWYTLKAIICVLLGRNDLTWRDDRIVVAEFDFQKWSSQDGMMYDWREIVVGTDKWQAKVQTDGHP